LAQCLQKPQAWQNESGLGEPLVPGPMNWCLTTD